MIEVVAGILRSRGDSILLAERTGDSPFRGLWEFPGGKIRDGESPEAALRRELDEELGVSVIEQQHLMQLEHRYADRHVRLDFFEVLEWSGRPTGREGQALRWVSIGALDASELLPADAPVVEALKVSAAGR